MIKIIKHKILLYALGFLLLGTALEFYIPKDYLAVGVGIICMWITYLLFVE